MAVQQSFTLTPSFVGKVNFVGDISADPFPVSIGIGGVFLVSYDFSISMLDGKAQDPLIPFTNSAEGLLSSINLTFTGALPTTVINIFKSYSSGPWVDGASLSSEPNTSVIGQDSSPISPHSIDLDYSSDLQDTSGGGFTRSTIQTYVTRGTWDGTLSFGFINLSLPIITYSEANFTGHSIPFNTGWLGHHADEGRPVLDGITGFPTFVPELVEHGFHHGIWCADAAWDPDDPRRIRGTVELPDTEGEIGDDIPALK